MASRAYASSMLSRSKPAFRNGLAPASRSQAGGLTPAAMRSRPSCAPHFNDLCHSAAGLPCPAREGLHLCRPSLIAFNGFLADLGLKNERFATNSGSSAVPFEAQIRLGLQAVQAADQPLLAVAFFLRPPIPTTESFVHDRKYCPEDFWHP